MKIVEYDESSDEEEEKEIAPTKVEIKEKKKVSILKLPISKKLNILRKKASEYEEDHSSESKPNIQQAKTTKSETPTFSTLPPPKRVFASKKSSAHLQFQKASITPLPSIEPLEATSDPQFFRRTDFTIQRTSPSPSLQSPPPDPLQQSNSNPEPPSIKSSDLLDLDWKLHREKVLLASTLKSSLSSSNTLTQPDSSAKHKNQLTYLAYQALRNQDASLNQKEEFQEKHRKTQRKYGW